MSGCPGGLSVFSRVSLRLRGLRPSCPCLRAFLTGDASMTKQMTDGMPAGDAPVVDPNDLIGPTTRCTVRAVAPRRACSQSGALLLSHPWTARRDSCSPAMRPSGGRTGAPEPLSLRAPHRTRAVASEGFVGPLRLDHRCRRRISPGRIRSGLPPTVCRLSSKSSGQPPVMWVVAAMPARVSPGRTVHTRPCSPPRPPCTA